VPPLALRRLAGVVLAAGAATAAAGAACSLDLDASRIAPPADAADDRPDVRVADGRGDDAGGDGGSVADGSSDTLQGDQGSDALGDRPPSGDAIAAGGCTTNADCLGATTDAGSCVTSATCDTVRHACVVSVCDVGTCKAAACDPVANRCGTPKPYGFAVGHFAVTLGGVLSGAVGRAIAAVHPFVFVVTTNGVAAYAVVDPTSSSPPSVAVHGVDFVPAAAVAVAGRVYFVSGVQGSGPTYHHAIAWLDVPGDPRVASMQATSAWVGTPESALGTVLTNGVNGLYLVYSSGNLQPAASVAPPLGDSTLLVPAPNTGLVQGAAIVASSARRLIAYRYDSTNLVPDFALVNSAASLTAQAMAEQSISALGPLDGQASFAIGDDGSVLWTSASLQSSGLVNALGVASSLTWVLAGASATGFDASHHVTLESYPRADITASPATLVAPAGWIDPNTALALAAATENTQTTSVQVATQQPLALESGKRVVLSVAPGSVGVATSGGFGYVLAADDPKNVSASVYVFAPSCGNTDQ
jgi:hypothetical protein